jgi:hypothetical protein
MHSSLNTSVLVLLPISESEMYLPQQLVMKILNPVIPEDITQEVPQRFELIIGIILYNYGNQCNH